MTPEHKQFARRQPLALVDLGKLQSNYRMLSAASGPAECAAIVKGDGYGLGMLPCARASWEAGARTFFGARFADGLALRAELPAARIAVLDGLGAVPPGEFAAAGLTPVLGSAAELRTWFAKAAAGPAMLHIDTGMNRLGLKPREVPAIASLLRDNGQALELYLTHFASADDVDLQFCRQQVAAFEAALRELPAAPRSIVNSSGLYLGVPQWLGNLTRPGKALAGINPLPPGETSPVAQVMSVTAPILQVSEIDRGDSVGYSASFRAAKPMRIATLGIGYANGYLRSLSNCGIVAFAGQRAPVVGRVSMDLTTVDVTHLADAGFDDGYAEILGPTIGLTELASLAGTNEYEVQIALGGGCRRLYATGQG